MNANGQTYSFTHAQPPPILLNATLGQAGSGAATLDSTTYSGLSPFAWWTLNLQPGVNSGVSFDAVTSITLRMSGQTVPAS